MSVEYSAQNPPVPAFVNVGGFGPGKRVTVNGSLPHHSKRATVNFRTSNDIALHFDIRYPDKKIVLNTERNGNWEEEEKPGFFPFHHDTPFSLVFDVEDDGYRITLNGQDLAFYNHRIAPYEVTAVEIDHEARVDYLEIFNTRRPEVPYSQHIHGGLKPGRTINVTGTAPYGAEKFTINLKAHDDIAFHFDVRFGPRTVVRNTLQGGDWQTEEKEGHFPFQHNHQFTVQIQTSGHAYVVTVNGQYFCEYHHRIPSYAVNELEILNNVELQSVSIL